MNFLWRLRWNIFILVLCSAVSSASRSPQAATGFLIAGGIVALILKGIARVFLGRDEPTPGPLVFFWDKRSSKVGVAALVFAAGGGELVSAAMTVLIANGLAVAMLVLAIDEVRDEIAAEAGVVLPK